MMAIPHCLTPVEMQVDVTAALVTVFSTATERCVCDVLDCMNSTHLTSAA